MSDQTTSSDTPKTQNTNAEGNDASNQASRPELQGGNSTDSSVRNADQPDQDKQDRGKPRASETLESQQRVSSRVDPNNVRGLLDKRVDGDQRELTRWLAGLDVLKSLGTGGRNEAPRLQGPDEPRKKAEEMRDGSGKARSKR